jgi:microcompartment protein CcmL/EutN
LSEDPSGRDPAIGLIELTSIARGVTTADAMVKASPVGSLYAGTVHPGKYLVLVSGDTASVEEAMLVGVGIAGSRSLGTILLPDIDPGVVKALTEPTPGADLGGEAVGIVETATVAALFGAADAGAKAARVVVAGIRLADGLGGKAYVVFTGPVAEIEAAVEAAVEGPEASGTLVEWQIIPLIAAEVVENLAADLSFAPRIGARPSERG